MSENSNFEYAVVLAAGKGTRFYSSVPKVLHSLCGRTLLERSIRAVIPFVKSKIIIVSGFGYDLVQEEIRKIETNVTADCPQICIVKQEEQKGTGHAATVALEEVKEVNSRVLIIPGDCPLIDESVIANSIADMAKNAFSILSFEAKDPFGFGRIIRSSSGTLLRIVEHRDCTDQEKMVTEVNSGIVFSNSEILEKYLPRLSPANNQGEYYLTDIPQLLVNDGVSVGVVKAKDPILVQGANTRSQLSELESFRRKKIIEKHMNAGVTFENPINSYVDEDVNLENDIYIGAGTRLYGKTSIKRGVIIEGNSLIKDSLIGEGSVVRFSCYLDNCLVSSSVQIGPFAHIRPNSSLSENVKIGNFVETKAARLSSGVKANHLSYLGDVEVGSNTNIGAGTIVCNYDGTKKSKTVIGKNSFVGSNSTLIAPVEIMSDAYVAAGSVISKTVPSKALGIGRARQQNYEGWMDKKRTKKS
ncbi:MAG TPA: bifunctional UDP-N-acetylglucosamine diphosphorylase/glucosamine-1-phosphate N-acetyltransferase GlmU [Oligoflexia bacterium]|nr:bifunctional UDP-N-acetylglucosamine diphosphorylase/glucosamine-1-phosphate N-acetyltransferase GlmU [Oligoflexia bacterium]HMP49652.1 bifunctional UDP-N-acetylglucosamine diphosphorylase/glucosamine-1-phosphate N-acetyltransferase GlmU [Oligoflexia bacterium]